MLKMALVFGEIQDEFDEERPLVENRGEYAYSVDGRLLLEEVSQIIGLKLDSDDFDTIGGWVYARVEVQPHIGQKVDFGDFEFIVEEVDHMRIHRVLIKKAEGDPGPDEGN